MRTYCAIVLFFMAALVAVTVGCKKMAESAAETASGGKVKFDGDKITVAGDKGQKAVFDTKGGTAVVTDEKGQQAKVTADGTGVKVESKEGTAQFGTQEVPKDFPLPMYAGTKVGQTMHATTDGDAYSLVATIDAPFKDVSAFYEKALKEKGLEVASAVQQAGGTEMVTLSGKKDKIESAVIIMKAADQPTAVTVTWNAKK